MDSSKFEQFRELYNSFRLTEAYRNRKTQTAIVPVLRDIIRETLKNPLLENKHLTGLIQMFKNNATNESFDSYLEANISDQLQRDALSARAYEIGINGYTNAGKATISKLSRYQLDVVRKFLLEAFTINSVEKAAKLCEEFDSKDIPEVKKGVYSPWLYYINPEIFPIINNVHTNFLQWIEIEPKYPSCIRAFSQLKNLVNEKDLGLLDWFAYDFESESLTDTSLRTLNLAGKKLFKISHGIFVNYADFKKSGIIKVLENKNWISLATDTTKNQYHKFKDYATIGDYVYICYGGMKVYGLGRIISDMVKFDDETTKLVKDQVKWVYREIEPLFFPTTSSITELKDERKGFMPSANSTFKEVPKDQLDYINEKFFIPKFKLKIIDEMEKGEGAKSNIGIKTNELNSKNIILYGPPGTGKTFQSINYALAIVENRLIQDVERENRKDVKKRYDEYIKRGQIIFTTFHQSMGYEDFIEGIKPNIDEEDEDTSLFYEVKDGLFKKLCTEAAFSFVKQNATAETEKVLGFSEQYDRYIEILLEDIAKKGFSEIPTKNGGKIIIQAITKNKNIEFIHPNGRRTYIVSKSRLSQVSQAFPDINSLTNIYEQIRDVIGGMNSTGYWAILNAIRNLPVFPVDREQKARTKEYSYEDKKDAIKALSNEDYKTINSKNYVIIVDEINRGNVSQIFGELITLIEDDKRAGKDESLIALLPYTGDHFSVPPNLHIIGTMNTADRSVEALDTALRRRFSFVPILPEPDRLPVKNTKEDIELPKLLKSINDRLAILKDNDHTIGHAWLWNVTNLEELQLVFANKILPLLQEFFYNDYEKLGLVLGDDFFETNEQVTKKVFARFKGSSDLADQYTESRKYQLKQAGKLTAENFQSLYKYSVETSDNEE